MKWKSLISNSMWFLVALVSISSAQGSEAPPVQYTLGGQLIFWIGAMALMLFMGRFMFREQLNERRTLSRLIKEIGPFYPEFDIDNLKRWVNLCAPHIWAGFETSDWSKIEDFVTTDFIEDAKKQAHTLQEQHLTLKSKFVSILKVHPLGVYMVGDGPAPRNVELMLRLEQKAMFHLTDARGKTKRGRSDIDQVQHFWTLLHDGHRFRLNRVWLAEEDATDLNQRPAPPVVTDWKRPVEDVENTVDEDRVDGNSVPKGDEL